MSQPLPLKIAGLGRYLPERQVTSQEVEQLCHLPPGWVVSRSGVRVRRWVNGESNSQMGAAAAREAVEQAGLTLEQIDLLINASGTPEQAIPDGGPLLQRCLGLGESGIPALTVHATCLSFLAALDLSASLLASGRYRHILIVSTEITSLGLNFSEPESASLMGDAAAAAVVTRAAAADRARLLTSRLETYGVGAHLTEIRGGGSRCHPNRPGVRPDDHLFHMDGPPLFRLALKQLPPFLERLRPGLTTGLGSIRLVVPHQASRLGLRLLRRFGWPDEQVIRTLDWMGNCVAASIPAALYEAVQQERLARGDEILLLGTGAGLSLGGIILIY